MFRLDYSLKMLTVFVGGVFVIALFISTVVTMLCESNTELKEQEKPKEKTDRQYYMQAVRRQEFIRDIDVRLKSLVRSEVKIALEAQKPQTRSRRRRG